MATGAIREKVSFENDQGHVLAGLLERPAGAPKAYALFAHCFTCSKNVAAATWISRALAARGFAVLRFDFTGLGNSEGDFSNTNFSSNVRDLVNAAEYMRQHYGSVDLLIGHSLGGAAVLAAAADLPECEAVVTIGAPADPAHVARLLASRREIIESEGEAEVCLAGRSFNIRKQFLDDIEAQSQRRRIGALGKALLVMHAPLDEYVDIDNAAQIFKAARHPKSFITLDSADHLLTDSRDAEYAAGVIAAWAVRYIISEHEGGPGERTVPERREVLVRETGNGLTSEIYTGGHHLVADEPEPAGGNDLGPDPYQYLLAALGACTVMTLRLYARRKTLPLESVVVTLRHEKVYAEDCRDCDSRERRLDRIERVIELKGGLDEAQRRRLLEIADRCPVHRTLESKVHIDSRLAAD